MYLFVIYEIIKHLRRFKITNGKILSITYITIFFDHKLNTINFSKLFLLQFTHISNCMVHFSNRLTVNHLVYMIVTRA